MKKQLIIDLAGLSGFSSLIYGVWLIRHDAAFITAGMLLMLFAYKASK